MKAAGVFTLGYVATTYGNRPLAAVETEVSNWWNWYHVNGIMFDEMAYVTSPTTYQGVTYYPSQSYYSTLTAYAKSLGMTYTMGNPGINTDPSYIGTVDSMSIYEGSGMPTTSYLQSSSPSPKTNWAFVAYGVPTLDASSVTTDSSYVAWEYVTDQTGPSGPAYNRLPVYFSSLVAALDPPSTTTSTTTSSSTASTTTTFTTTMPSTTTLTSTTTSSTTTTTTSPTTSTTTQTSSATTATTTPTTTTSTDTTTSTATTTPTTTSTTTTDTTTTPSTTTTTATSPTSSTTTSTQTSTTTTTTPSTTTTTSTTDTTTATTTSTLTTTTTPTATTTDSTTTTTTVPTTSTTTTTTSPTTSTTTSTQSSSATTTTPTATTSTSTTGSTTTTTLSTTTTTITSTSTLTTSTTTITSSTATGIVLNGVQATSGTVSASPYQLTISNFNAGTGTNRLLVVGVSANNLPVASVSFGGVPLTQAVGSFYNNDAQFWYLLNPTGTTNIVVTMSGATSAVIGAYAFSGVDQGLPIPTTVTQHNTVAGSPSLSITTKYTNSWLLDLPSIYGGVTLSSPTGTQQWDVNVPNAITGASSSKIALAPGQVTLGWTASRGDFWDDAAIEIHAAAATTTTSTTATTTTTTTLSTTSTTTITTTTTSTTTTTATTSATSATINLQSDNLAGTSFAGIYTVIKQGSTTVFSGYTPVTFTGVVGQQYTVTVSNFNKDLFNHWDDGTTNPTRTITLAHNTALTAYYNTPVSLTIKSATLSGGSLTGMHVVIKSGNTILKSGSTPLTYTLESGTTYTITISGTSSHVFDHWDDGTTNPTRTITPTQNMVLTAYFK